MKRGSLLLGLAAGVIASFAISAPSEAGSVYFTNAVFVNDSGKAASDFEADFTNVGGTIYDVVVYNPPSGASPSITDNGSGVMFNFSPSLPVGHVLDFGFYSTVSMNVGVSWANWTFPTGSPSSTAPIYMITSSVVVPEPASLALLGIGITGLTAFRRMFQRKPLV